MHWLIIRWEKFICSTTQRHYQKLDRCHQMHFPSLHCVDKILLFTAGISDKRPTFKSHKPQTNWGLTDRLLWIAELLHQKKYWKILQECHEELLWINTRHPWSIKSWKSRSQIQILVRFEFVPDCKPKSINIASWGGICLMLFRGIGCTVHMVT